MKLGLTGVRGLRSTAALCVCVAAGTLLSYNALFAPHPRAARAGVLRTAQEPWDSTRHVVGLPTENFRDNLRNDTSYVTAWADAGFTNEFIAYVNLIYLGVLSGRVPIIPPFAPFHHVDQSAGILPFSEVFDLDALRSHLRAPILEWQDIQSSRTPHREPLGCWSAWATGNINGNHYRRLDSLTQYLNLDLSYTPVPHSTRRLLDREGEWDYHLLFWDLAVLIHPASPPPPSEPALFEGYTGSRLPPDAHMSCFDLLYYMSASRKGFEWDYEWSPEWRFVAKYLRFVQPLQTLVEGYVRRALNWGPGALPPYIAVHVRRGDFMSGCYEEAIGKQDECFAPLSAYVRRVHQVQDELFEKKGISVPDHHVLLTSDETDPIFWADVAAQGWRFIDHEAERTLETYGEWYVTLVDIVAQGLSLGFVGTDRSTVSIVSAHRVRDWYGGVTRTVRWGRLGADDEHD